MARITREQYNKWSAMAANGFEFDLQWFAIWSEKRIHKLIKQPDGGYIEFIIEFRKESPERWSREYTYTPILKIHRLTPSSTSGCYIVTTIKDNIRLGEPMEKRAYKALCECSKGIDTAEYLEQINNERAA